MSDDRLPTEFWVSAQLRRLSNEGTGAYLLRRGDDERGTVLVRLVVPGGTKILTQVRDLDGVLGWLAVRDGTALSPDEADAYVDRALQRDSDIWVIEIESRDGRSPFDEDVVGL